MLCQVIHHVNSKLKQAVEQGVLASVLVGPPFEITTTTIGGITLTKLDENDDGNWSRVIHYMASDLLWLSDCASSYVLEQVQLNATLAPDVPAPSEEAAEYGFSES